MGALNVTLSPWLIQQYDVLVDILAALGGAPGPGGATTNSYSSLGRLLVSEPHTVFEAEFIYDEQPNLFDFVDVFGNGGITQNFTERTLELSTSDKDPSEVYAQSFQHIPYQQSKPQVTYITSNFKGMPADANVTKYVGIYDGATGITVGVTNNTYYVDWKSGGTAFGDILKNQVDWNLDVLDGTGASGYTLDVTANTQYSFLIDFQAVQLGKVRVGVYIAEELVWFHQFTAATTVTSNAMAYLSLPVRFGIIDVLGAEQTMEVVNVAVIQEGGNPYDEGYSHTYTTSTTAVDAVEKHVISLGRSEFFNSLENYSTLVLENVEVMTLGTEPVIWRLRYKAQLNGTGTIVDNFTDAARLTVGATGFTSLGFEIRSGFAPAGDKNKSSNLMRANMGQLYPITLSDLENYHLTVEGIGGTPVVHVALNWREIR